MSSEIDIPIVFREKYGIERFWEPVKVGVPFAKGQINKVGSVGISDDAGRPIPFAADVLATWPDESLKWVLFYFQVSLPAFSERIFRILTRKWSSDQIDFPAVTMLEDDKEFTVRTGTASFVLDKVNFMPFKQVLAGESHIISPGSSRIILTDDHEGQWLPRVERIVVECNNALTAGLRFEGIFANGRSEHVLRFKSRLYFYSGQSSTRVVFTIWNPHAAVHAGGLWDLGDPGSSFFKDLSFDFSLSPEEITEIQWQSELNSSINSIRPTDSTIPTNLVIYQDSSGGENWRSRNHVNRLGKIPLSFKGYEVSECGRKIAGGDRATPVVAITCGQHSVAATMRHFWQNFPSAIKVQSNCLRISQFPRYFADKFELQGGEQKTDTIYLDFGKREDGIGSLAWIHHPLVPEISPNWYFSSGAFPYVIPRAHIPPYFPYREAYELVEVGIKGDNTFFDRREIIDEYGWRNFGDNYADHENLLYEGEKPIISHYNNQYDLIKSFLIQSIRTSDDNWFRLAEELAWHCIDIDIYHTDNDTYAYNHGLFWHTDHYVDAATSTHRSYSSRNVKRKKLNKYGGGPSYEHVYSEGLLIYYLLTGETYAKEAFMELASFVLKGIEGPPNGALAFRELIKKTLDWLRNRLRPDEIIPYGLLDGPGRSSGNAVCVLLDAFILTKDRDYLGKAEYLIRQCIHPEDNLLRRNLSAVNIRTTYTIFLQALEKYLDIKAQLCELDFMYYYARESLVQYARWILINEVPFLSRRELLDYPNYATRAAADLRKCNVLLFAAKYSEDMWRNKLVERANFFFSNSVKDLLSLETRFFVRPLAILMQNIDPALYFSSRHEERIDTTDHRYSFGRATSSDSILWLGRSYINYLKRLLRRRRSKAC